MKKVYVLFFLILGTAGVWGQVSLTNGTPSATIDFSNTTPTGVGSNPSTAFTGAGFDAATATAGRLNSNAWAVTGWSNGNLTFGGTQITAATDYTRGATGVAQTTGGMYAYTGAPGSAANPTLMIQPGGSDWAPGTLTLRIQNNGTSNITQLAVNYNIYVRNDQARSNSFNFSYSPDDVTYTPVAALDYTSTAAIDALGWVIVGTAPSRTTTITGLSVVPGGYVYIRWSGADVGGSGSRDEFGLDDINMTATYAAAGGHTISTGAVTTPPFCVDATNTASGSVAFTTTGTYAGETITALLSDAAGSFAAPVPVGTTTVTGVDPSGSITITIPAGTPTGTGYKIRIDESTFPVTGSESSAFKIVNGVENITGLGSSFTPTTVTLNWTNPTSCFDEVLIVAKPLTTIAGTPTGDGTAYTADLDFLGAGSSFDGTGKVVYKGTTSPQTVTNLTTGVTYFFRVFSRYGTNWSNGVEISVTPALASSPTDYFRTVASGSWSTQAIWESSSDSSAWIPATLLPGALASHVVVQSPDSVWLTDLRTTANLTIMSGAKFNATTFTLTATVRFNLLGTASFYQGGTSTFVPGIQQVLAPASNYHYNGVQNGLNSGTYPEFGNFLWEPTATTAGTFQNTLVAVPFNLGLVVRGNMTINIQGATPREIRFATGTTVTRSHTIDGNLNIISSSSVVVITNGGIPVQSTVTVGGNINISAGILQGTSSSAGTNGNAVLNLRGNINNTGGTIQTGASTAGLFSLNYVGTSPQSINNTGGTFSFTANQRDSINNSGNGVTLNTPITHNGTINFLSGIVNTTAANLLTMGAASSVLNASNASYVNGPVKKIGNTNFTFPVGKTNGYVPLGISSFSGASAATDELTAEYIRASGSALGAVTAPFINRVSSCEYWNLNVNNGTPTVDLTLYWNANNPCGGTYIANVADIEIAHFDGTNWNSSSTGFSSKTGTAAAGDVTWIGVNTFSPFTIASVSNSNPLPITINYFNGTRSNGSHLLNWKVTCVSTPSATLEMERSTDGRNYSSIYSIFATAIRCQQPFNYTDAQPVKGINYYRLKMTDADGKITYSTIVTLINAVKGIDVMNIAPNPIVNGAFNLKVSTAEKIQMELVITDMQGRILQKQSVPMIAGFNSIPMNVRNLAAGTYQLFGNTADGRTRVLRFVVQ